MKKPHIVEAPPAPVADDHAAPLRAAFVARMREVPGAVAIIATRAGGVRAGLAATAWCSLSADPPTMLVCVNRNASAHDVIAASGVFSVNQLGAAHQEVVAIFSNQRGLQGDGRFLAGDWREGGRGAPLFNGAVTAYECAVVSHLVYSTHSIFIGQVVEILAADEAVDPAAYFKGALCGVSAAPSAGGQARREPV